jgi:hypothetical protein
MFRWIIANCSDTMMIHNFLVTNSKETYGGIFFIVDGKKLTSFRVFVSANLKEKFTIDEISIDDCDILCVFNLNGCKNI